MPLSTSAAWTWSTSHRHSNAWPGAFVGVALASCLIRHLSAVANDELPPRLSWTLTRYMPGGQQCGCILVSVLLKKRQWNDDMHDVDRGGWWWRRDGLFLDLFQLAVGTIFPLLGNSWVSACNYTQTHVTSRAYIYIRNRYHAWPIQGITCTCYESKNLDDTQLLRTT